MVDFPPLNANSMKSLSAFRSIYSAAAAKWLQSCPTLCGPTDGSPLGSAVPGIQRLLFHTAIHRTKNLPFNTTHQLFLKLDTLLLSKYRIIN